MDKYKIYFDNYENYVYLGSHLVSYLDNKESCFEKSLKTVKTYDFIKFHPSYYLFNTYISYNLLSLCDIPQFTSERDMTEQEKQVLSDKKFLAELTLKKVQHEKINRQTYYNIFSKLAVEKNIDAKTPIKNYVLEEKSFLLSTYVAKTWKEFYDYYYGNIKKQEITKERLNSKKVLTNLNDFQTCTFFNKLRKPNITINVINEVGINANHFLNEKQNLSFDYFHMLYFINNSKIQKVIFKLQPSNEIEEIYAIIENFHAYTRFISYETILHEYKYASTNLTDLEEKIYNINKDKYSFQHKHTNVGKSFSTITYNETNNTIECSVGTIRFRDEFVKFQECFLFDSDELDEYIDIFATEENLQNYIRCIFGV